MFVRVRVRVSSCLYICIVLLFLLYIECGTVCIECPFVHCPLTAL